ncbi:hypothetical protein HN873_013724 [Arachis hypogaea]
MERKHLNDILPRELIDRIFLRVPAKDLFRLRFVSKLWHSLISDPHFAESYYNFHSASSPSVLLQQHHQRSKRYLSLPGRSHVPFFVSWDPIEALFS